MRFVFRKVVVLWYVWVLWRVNFEFYFVRAPLGPDGPLPFRRGEVRVATHHSKVCFMCRVRWWFCGTFRCCGGGILNFTLFEHPSALTGHSPIVGEKFVVRFGVV